MRNKKIMNIEIKKYINHIYYLEERFDCAGNRLEPHIGTAHWINSTSDYDHCSFELHHVVPFTDWELNTRNVREKVGSNALILLPKKMHQHLENPIYKLGKEDFERVYKINPDKILFDVNSKIERTEDVFFINLISGSTKYPNIYDPDFFNIDLSNFDFSHSERSEETQGLENV